MRLLAAIVGPFAAILPARLWPDLDLFVPATRCALLSSVLTLLAGGILAIGGFVQYAQRQAGLINDHVLSSPQAARMGDDLTTVVLQGASVMSVFTFLLTPTGIAASYLTLSGVMRAVTATVAEGFGDPLLTVVDRIGLTLFRGTSARRARRARESQEGPNVPDQILRGAHLGLAADLVIVAARRKHDWDRGTIVRSGERWYRVGAIEERTIHGRLRSLYPLTEVHDHAAIRRLVDYEIPAKYLTPPERGS